MSTRGIVIKVDNRETDLIPLIERRIDAHMSDASVASSSRETSNKSIPLKKELKDISQAR